MMRGAAARASCHPPPLPRILSEQIMRNYKGYIHYVLLKSGLFSKKLP